MSGGYALRLAELSPGLSREVTIAQATVAIVPNSVNAVQLSGTGNLSGIAHWAGVRGIRKGIPP